MTTQRTRLAPSPTGALHIGNASSFLVNWAIARKYGWEILLRMEDLDGPRKKGETIQTSIDILTWLGLDWDGEMILQSDGIQHSRDTLQSLINQNLAYHCELTRKEIDAVASAPHGTTKQSNYSIRPNNMKKHNEQEVPLCTNWRFVANHCSMTLEDMCCTTTPQLVESDFVIWTKSNSPSYQLAVVVDDHRQGITDVIRGNDLFHSAALQTQLYEALGWQIPTWWHLPLILGPDNKRLAKRHGDSRLETFRNEGIPPERIIGLIATWCDIQESPAPMNAITFCEELDVPSIPKENKIFTLKEKQWLFDF